jgi:hypothetical protein
MKKTFFSGVLCCACLLLQAQTPPTGSSGLWQPGHFLWFTGHWSKQGNKLTFVIDKGKGSAAGGGGSLPTGGAGSAPAGNNPASDPDAPTNPPGGGTIAINPDGSVHLNNNSVDAWNKKMDQALNSEQQYLQDLQDPGDNLDPTTHQLNVLLQPDAQENIDHLKAYKIDPSQDVLSTNDKPAAPAKSLSDIVAKGCGDIKAQYNLVMSYYKNQIKGHSADLNVPPPPQQDLDCYSCDSSLRKIYDTAVAHYIADFLHPEDSMVRKALSLLRSFALLGVSEEAGTYGELGDLWNKNGACSFVDIGALSEAVVGITHHLFLRAEKLIELNKKNYKAAKAVIQTYLICAREWAMRCGHVDDDEGFPPIRDLVSLSVDHYISELEHNDWRQIGNLSLIYDELRTYEMFGGTDAKDKEFENRLLKIMNGFEMTIEMDIKMGEEQSYRLAHLKGQCHVIPSFVRDANQCYKWVVADDNGQGGLGIYKAKGLQTIDCDVVALEKISPPQVPKTTYTGTKKYTARLLNLSMNFCNPGHDTIVLSNFSPNPPQAGTWLHYGNQVSGEGVNGMEHNFEDMKAQKKLADDGEVQQASADMQARSQELQAQMQNLQAQMGNLQSGAQGGANFEKLMEMNNKMIAQLSAPTIAKMLWLDFLLDVQNNQPILVHNEFDAKKINPDLAKAIIYGYYRIDIKNEANGKIKPKNPAAPSAPGPAHH